MLKPSEGPLLVCWFVFENFASLRAAGALQWRLANK